MSLPMRTVLVDVGLGNIRSVERAVEAAARLASLPDPGLERTGDPDRIRTADRVIFPGQGGFAHCAAALGQGVGESLREVIAAGRPYLGICLGLQLLFADSEEAPGSVGLGLLPGSVKRLAVDPGLKVPHMGWNRLEVVNGGHPCFADAASDGQWFYFVHSFHGVSDDPSLVRGTVRYGSTEVTAAVARDNLLATQFHPEKSQRLGLSLLAAFLAWRP